MSCMWMLKVIGDYCSDIYLVRNWWMIKWINLYRVPKKELITPEMLIVEKKASSKTFEKYNNAGNMAIKKKYFLFDFIFLIVTR